jgi:DNA-binding winged helix-turn-helix (wHTH) protein
LKPPARFGRFVLQTGSRQLLRDGAEIHLTPKAFDLLRLLIERAPAVVTKAEIHEHLWPSTFVADTTLVGLIKELRRALQDESNVPRIRTIHRVGYAFAESLDTDAPEQAAAVPTHWLVHGTRRIALRDGENVIGRDPDAAVWLDVAGVSRRHVRITLERGKAILEDLGSKNGTLLRDRPVRTAVELRNTDTIQIASEVLVFHESTSGMSTLTQPVTRQKPHRKAT